MWARYVLIAVVALLIGVVLGSYLIPTVRVGGQVTIAVLQPIPEGAQSWRFVVTNPRTEYVTVYAVDEGLRIVGSAKY